jgi:succinate dehydrogenase/fumarate reductase flavoprotein subunit
MFDSAPASVANFIDMAGRKGRLIQQAQTWDEMASALLVPADVLKSEIEKYNSYVAAGKDPDFNKSLRKCTPLVTPPFYAIELTARHYTTYGGISVDLDSHVLKEDGTVIPGLYAAGTCCGSFFEQEGLYYLGGVSQTLAFGRQAGKNAAAEKPTA